MFPNNNCIYTFHLLVLQGLKLVMTLEVFPVMVKLCSVAAVGICLQLIEPVCQFPPPERSISLIIHAQLFSLLGCIYTFGATGLSCHLKKITCQFT